MLIYDIPINLCIYMPGPGWLYLPEPRRLWRDTGQLLAQQAAVGGVHRTAAGALLRPPLTPTESLFWSHFSREIDEKTTFHAKFGALKGL